jgi:hypothetical protein
MVGQDDVFRNGISYKVMDIITISVVAPFLFFLLFMTWRRLVISVLVLVVLEGIARKWILPQASNLIYFAKDFILVVAYYKYFILYGNKVKYHNVNYVILLLIIWAFAQIFNPELGSPIVGLFGLRAYLMYLPIMWMLPDLFSVNIEELYKFLRNYSLLAIPICLLATAQFFSPPSSPLNVYASGSEHITTFGVGKEAIVRVTGSFPYITGFGTYLTFSFTLLIPLITLKQSIIWRNLTIIELLLVVASSFMTGSRTVVFYQLFFMVGYVIIFLIREPLQAIPIVKKFTFPLIVGATIIPIYFSKSVNLFNQRVESNSAEGITRFYTPFTEPAMALYHVVRIKSLDSYGTGFTHQATPIIRSLLRLTQVRPISAVADFTNLMNIGEGEWGRVAIEIGAFGLAAWVSVRLCLLIALWNVFQKVSHPFLQQLAVSAFLFQLIQISTPVIFNTTMGIYYWFLSGFIFLLPAIESAQQQEYYAERSNLEPNS